MTERARRSRPPVTARQLATALLLAATALPGAWPLAHGAPDPVVLLAWLALVAVPVGLVAGSVLATRVEVALCVPAAWIALLVGVDALSPRDLPSPAWAALALVGLFLGGTALGRFLARESIARAASAAFFVASLLAALPLAGALLDAPFPPAASARLLDLAPTTLVEECAGVDWMRDPSVYEAAGTADVDPSIRTAWHAPLASVVALVVGCSAFGLASRRARAG